MGEGIRRSKFTIDFYESEIDRDESVVCFYESEIDLDNGYYVIDIIGGELIYGID